jgi:hypothetical protein
MEKQVIVSCEDGQTLSISIQDKNMDTVYSLAVVVQVAVLGSSYIFTDVDGCHQVVPVSTPFFIEYDEVAEPAAVPQDCTVPFYTELPEADEQPYVPVREDGLNAATPKEWDAARNKSTSESIADWAGVDVNMADMVVDAEVGGHTIQNGSIMDIIGLISKMK